MRITITVPDEPYPRSPVGISAGIKLKDWLELADELAGTVDLDVIEVGDLAAEPPHIVEGFTLHGYLLGKTTYPTAAEDALLHDLRAYWPWVMQAGIPAIEVYAAGVMPPHFPIFVRGRRTSIRGQGRVNSAAQLRALQLEHDLVIRPWVDIATCGRRGKIAKELRVHIVARQAVAVEYLFPDWAASRPTEAELKEGRAWAQHVVTEVIGCAEAIATRLEARWFVADFAQTPEGVLLIELNPGWCAGVTHAISARAVHLAILSCAFGIRYSTLKVAEPLAGVPFANLWNPAKT